MPTILIVDDEELDREAARRHLRELGGLDLRFAEDGNRALQEIVAHPPDLVLTDLRMPGMDGLELVETLTAEHPLIAVVLMTSQGNEKIAVRALQAGAASYVPKRHLKQELADTVRGVLEIAEARKSQHRVLQYLRSNTTRLELENDPGLIVPAATYFHKNLERLGFGDEALRTQLCVALVEALSNSMIHGNLEVDSTLRGTDRAEYYRCIEERRQQAPYAARRLRCESRETTDEVEYTFADEGPGFDPTTIPDPRAAENLLKVSGRGILLIRTFMDRVEFNDKGNQITMKKRAPSEVTTDLGDRTQR